MHLEMTTNAYSFIVNDCELPAHVAFLYIYCNMSQEPLLAHFA